MKGGGCAVGSPVCCIAQPFRRAAPSFLLNIVEKGGETVLRCSVGQSNSLRRHWYMRLFLKP